MQQQMQLFHFNVRSYYLFSHYYQNFAVLLIMIGSGS